MLSSEEIPQPFAIRLLREFLATYDKQKKKAALLHGPPGVGKTSSVYALARELGFEVVEVNSSDVRNKSSIESVIGRAAFQKSLVAHKKVLLIDEVDGISGNADRGGVQALKKILEKSVFPIVMTANTLDKKIKILKTRSLVIEYKPIPVSSIKQILEQTAKEKGIPCDDDALHTLARTSEGDLRAALQDLRALMVVTGESVQQLDIREKQDTMENALAVMFQGRPEQAKKAFDKTNTLPDEWLSWVDENMPRQYRAKERSEAYHFLSRADVFTGRIRKQQHWRYLAYVAEFITTGVSSVKQGPKDYAKYRQPGRFLSMWIANQKYAKRNALLKKMAKAMHCSTAILIRHWPLLHTIVKQKKLRDSIAKELSLEQEQLDWLHA